MKGVLRGLLCIGLLTVFAWCPAALVASETPKVAGIFTVPIQQKWVARIHTTLVKAKESGKIDYVWSENVPNTDYVRVMRQYAESGVDLIVGESYGISREARRVADDYTDVNFVMGDPGKPHGTNFSVFDTLLYQPAYLMGILAGSMTETNVIGMVGGYPVAAQVNRTFNAFMEGARSVNPQAKFKVSFIGSWYDPPKAKEVTFAQIEAGADQIYAERTGVVDAARERGILAYGHVNDMNKEENGKNVVVTSALWSMEPAIAHAIKMTKAGTFEAENYMSWMLMDKGGASLAPYYEFDELIPDAVKAKVEQVKGDILSGKFEVPIDDGEPKSTF